MWVRLTSKLYVRIWLAVVATVAVLTFAVTPSVGPFSLDLLVLSFTIGPVVLTVSVMAVVGVVLAYLLARSLF